MIKPKATPPERASGDRPAGAEPRDDGLLKCVDIQDLLFDYMNHELGDVQSRVVREHLRLCVGCREQAAEIETMLSALQAVDSGTDTQPLRLSEERRERMYRAVFHPVMDWIHCHHRLVSGVVALLTLLAALFLLRQAAIFREAEIEDGIPIWRMFRSGGLPARVEEARDRYRRLQELDREQEETPE